MNSVIKTNEIVNNFLLAGNKSISEIHLKKPGFTYSACGPFLENKERIQKFRVTRDTKYVYRNELDKACFQHNMAYGGFKDFQRRTAFDKVLRDEKFNIVKNLKYDGYQKSLASIVYKVFHKKPKGSGIKNELPLDFAMQQLAKELHKPIIQKFFKKEEFILHLKTIFGVVI